MLADSPINPQTWLLIGIVLIIGVLLIRRSRTRRGDPGVDGRTAVHSRMHNDRLASQAREDIDELMVRLDELSREICGQIDTRFAKLEHAIMEADAKLAALRAAANAAGVETEPAPLDPKHAEVCRRAQEGQTELQIAREMDMPIGEVELILSLRRSVQQAAESGSDDEAAAGKGRRVDKRA